MFSVTELFHILPGDPRQTRSELPDVAAKLETWKLKMFYCLHFLQSNMVFGSITFFFVNTGVEFLMSSLSKLSRKGISR